MGPPRGPKLGGDKAQWRTSMEHKETFVDARQKREDVGHDDEGFVYDRSAACQPPSPGPLPGHTVQ